MKLSAGTLLQGGKYRIKEHLGSGGFGCTYKAYYNTMGCYVAIKEFFVKDFCNREEDGTVKVATQGKTELVEKLRNKFFNEARTLFSSKMYHSNIVRVSDVFEENGTVYYVMDYIEGSTLATLIEQKGYLAEDEALRYIRQVADALKHLHANNCLHLDVKPANIMIDGSGKAVLIDFGVSKQYDEANGENTSTLLGHTPGYAPIEQSGRGLIKFNAACDIYALGATLYKALTGMTPVEATLRAGDKSLCGLTYPEHVSAAIRTAIDKAMQISRGDRPQSIEEFLCLVESGKIKDESGKPDAGETVLNGNVKGASKREGENLFTHTASESSFDEVKGENGKLVADESQSIDVVEVPDSADTVISNEGEKSHSAKNEILRSAQNDNSGGNVISNESEKSQKNKPGKFLWLILLLLLIAVAGACFLFGGAGNGDASKTNASPVGNQSEAPEVANEAGTLIPILDSATDKFGFIDQSGTEVVPCKYDWVGYFSEGLACVNLNDKCGFIDQSGTEVIPCKYDGVKYSHEGLAAVELNGKCGFIDQSGTEIIPCKYDYVNDFSEGLAAVKLNDKWGYIDKNGTEVIPYKYDLAGVFSEGLACVKLNDKDGFIDKNGTEVIPYKYDWAYSFYEGLAAVKLNDKWGYIDKNGIEVIPYKYDLACVFFEGLAAVELNGKWGVIDHNGTEVTPCKYDFAYSFFEGFAAVRLNDKSFYIDKAGKEYIK